MSNSSLYDDDILLWSEQQAAAIRELGRTRRDLPNELDIENIAKEIETVGRSELAAVKSQIRPILAYLIKLSVEPDSDAAPHWHEEIAVFTGELVDRYAPSMRQRIDIDELWRRARRQVLLAHHGMPRQQAFANLPIHSPFALEDLVTEPIDSFALVEGLREAGERDGK
jgi:hypothetical protein